VAGDENERVLKACLERRMAQTCTQLEDGNIRRLGVLFIKSEKYRTESDVRKEKGLQRFD